MLRIVFMGTPEFSVPMLAEIIGAGHDVVAVYSQPPRPAGRGMELKASPVQQYATASGIPVLTPKSLRTAEAQAAFAAHDADVAVVVAYGLILPKLVLEAPRYGCLNLHASALPRWRGAAPIQRAIMAGDATTAAMVMQMDEGLDTGPVCLAEHVPIDPDITAGALHDILSNIGAGLMVRALAALERGSLERRPQPEAGVTYAAKIEKSEAHVDFSRPAQQVHDHIRGLSPFPGAWVAFAGERLKVLRSEMVRAGGFAEPGLPPGMVLDHQLTVQCGEGAVRLALLQRAGKKPMTATELLRGFPVPTGSRFE